MHIFQLLDPLARGEDVEVIEAFLPEVMGQGREEVDLRAGALARAETFGDTLLQHLHDLRRVADLGLGDQEMRVLGHHDVSHDPEAKLGANLLEDAEEAVAAARTGKMTLPPVAARGDEVKVTVSVVALESGGHSRGFYLSALGNQAALAHPVVPKTGTKGGAPKISVGRPTEEWGTGGWPTQSFPPLRDTIHEGCPTQAVFA